MNNKRHIDQMLELALKYEKAGDMEKYNYWMKKAEWFENWIKNEENKKRKTIT